MRKYYLLILVVSLFVFSACSLTGNPGEPSALKVIQQKSAALDDAKIKVRDNKRVSDAKTIKTASGMYMSENGFCPDSLATLKEKPFLSITPADPLSKIEYEYIKSGAKDCQVCFNLERVSGDFSVGKNCLKITAE